QSRSDAAGQSSVYTAGSGSVSTSSTASGKPEAEQQGPEKVPTEDQTKEESQSSESCIIPPHLFGSGNSIIVSPRQKDPHHALKELARICIMADCTLILAWSPEEAGRYLETYKSYEKKPADVLKEQVEKNYRSQVTDCLTTVKSVNKTDAMTLLSTFSSLEGIIKASKEELVLCPGLGPQKARRLYDVLHQPLIKTKKKES
ncbi:DNA excision repair protein ERCC-1-like, partial [Sinocyclocheilus rhinocerous]|uniref:DNA excision repair protein ERCC-1-like n=1 Tax=Sinocyclocheilus rhinocerous TaxID=307959 RepID=UPI0007B8399C